MTLLPADYALGALAIVLAFLGLFRGFSGMLGFALGSASASAAAYAVWTHATSLVAVAWQRGAAALVAALVAFGVVRILVKKTVNGLLAQPSDALFGMVVGVAFAALALAAWAWSGLGLEYSALAQTVAAQFFR